MELWDKNEHGDFPIHLVCYDPHVSLHAIKSLIRRQAATVAMVDREQGLLPAQFAAIWDTSLDVMFYLLHNYPNALRPFGNATVMGPHQHPSVSAVRAEGPIGLMVETSSDDDDSKHEGHQHHSESCGPAKKKAKMMH